MTAKQLLNSQAWRNMTVAVFGEQTETQLEQRAARSEQIAREWRADAESEAAAEDEALFQRNNERA